LVDLFVIRFYAAASITVEYKDELGHWDDMLMKLLPGKFAPIAALVHLANLRGGKGSSCWVDMEELLSSDNFSTSRTFEPGETITVRPRSECSSLCSISCFNATHRINMHAAWEVKSIGRHKHLIVKLAFHAFVLTPVASRIVPLHLEYADL